MTRPTTRALTEFLTACEDLATDKAIRDALQLVTAARSDFATSAKMSRMRRLARECVYTATHGTASAAHDAWRRLDLAITYETDPTGDFRTAFRPLFAAIVESGQRLERECRQERLRRAGDLSHLPAVEQAYHRELRATFTLR